MACWADRYSLPLVRKYPLARERIFFLFSRRLLPRLTLGMRRPFLAGPGGPTRHAYRRRRARAVRRHALCIVGGGSAADVIVRCSFVAVRCYPFRCCLLPRQQHPLDVRL